MYLDIHVMSNTALQYPGALNSLERNFVSSLFPIENQQLNVWRGSRKKVEYIEENVNNIFYEIISIAVLVFLLTSEKAESYGCDYCVVVAIPNPHFHPSHQASHLYIYHGTDYYFLIK